MRRIMVDIAIAYIIGIIAASYFSLKQWVLLLVIFSASAFIWYSRFKSQLLMKLGLVIILIAFGWLNALMHSNIPSANDISMFRNMGTVEICGIVWDEPVADEMQTTLDLKASSVVVDGTSHDVSGILRVVIRYSQDHSQDFAYVLNFGDVLRITAPIYIPNVPSNPGQFDYCTYLGRQGIHSITYIYTETNIQVIGKARMPLWKTIRIHMLNYVRHCIDSSLSYPYNALLQSLLLGQRHLLPDDIVKAFEQAGILHVLAVSGLHVGFAGLMLYWLVTKCGVERKKSAAISLVGILLYAFIAGFRTSVVRATIMTGTMFLGIILDKERDSLNSLALSAFLICIPSPYSIFDVGFQLSFLAVFGILQLLPLINTIIPFIPKWLRNPISLSLSASLVTLPISAVHFNTIHPLGFVANIICVPVAGLCVKLGFILVCLGAISIYPARLVGFVVTIVLRILLALAKIFSCMPGSMVYVGTPSLWFILLYYALLLWLILPEKLNPFLKREAYYRRKCFIVLCAIIAVLVWAEVVSVLTPRIEITFLDVGFGDAIFIQTYNGHTLLIDAGNGPYERGKGSDSGLNVILPFLRHKGIKHIDVVVLSHPHEDHAGGLVSVLENISVGMVCDVAVEYTSKTYEMFLKTLAEKQLDFLNIAYGTSIQLGPGAVVEILHPPEDSSWRSTNVNNYSAVMKIEFRDWVFLLTGDIEEKAEKLLLDQGIDLKAHVLKVAHHGSNTSTGTDFLHTVMPDIAVISVGNNSYGLPSEEVIAQLVQENVKVYRTDKHGAITIIGKGNALLVRTVKNHEKE